MLFTPDNTEKILRGEKTQTRRVKKPGDVAIYDEQGNIIQINRNGRKWVAVGDNRAIQPGRGKKSIGYRQVKSLREEALQDISEGDAIAEGCEGSDGGARIGPGDGIMPDMWDYPPVTPQEDFACLWNNINTRPGHRWSDNPDVWVLCFTLVL